MENEEGKEEERDMERKAQKGKDDYNKEMKEREYGEKATPVFCLGVTAEWSTVFSKYWAFLSTLSNYMLQKQPITASISC